MELSNINKQEAASSLYSCTGTHSITPVLKDNNFVNRIIGQVDKSALCRCASFASSFAFYTSFLLALNKCFSNFLQNLQYEELEEN